MLIIFSFVFLFMLTLATAYFLDKYVYNNTTKKLPKHINPKYWQEINLELFRRFEPNKFRKLPADKALIEISKWLNHNIYDITKDLPYGGRDYSKDWKKKVSSELRKTIKQREYINSNEFKIDELYQEFSSFNLNFMIDQEENQQHYKEIKDIKPHRDHKFKKQIRCDDFTIKDLENAVKNDSGSPDIWGLNYEIFKNIPLLYPYLLEHFNRMVYIEELSSEWKESLIFFEKKPGKKDTLLESVRPFAKFLIVVRIYHRLLSDKMLNFVEDNDIVNRHLQKGNYRSFSGVQENVRIVKELITDANKNEKALSMLFLDIKNAYGTIKQEVIMHALEQYNFPFQFVDYVKRFYNNNQVRLTVNNKESEILDWNVGIFQGCSLSNILFIVSINLILDEIEHKFNESGYQYNDRNIILMSFVDDIVLVTHDREKLMRIYGQIEHLLNVFGFKLNYKKLRLLEVNQPELPLEINGVKINKLDENPNDFKYLGSYITSTEDKSVLVERYCQDLENVFQKIDNMKINDQPISNLQKFESYKIHIIPKIRWIYVNENLSKADYKAIEELENKYIMKWVPDTTSEKLESHHKHLDKSVENTKKKLLVLSKDQTMQDISMRDLKVNRSVLEEKASQLVETEEGQEKPTHFSNMTLLDIINQDDNIDLTIDVKSTKNDADIESSILPKYAKIKI